MAERDGGHVPSVDPDDEDAAWAAALTADAVAALAAAERADADAERADANAAAAATDGAATPADPDDEDAAWAAALTHDAVAALVAAERQADEQAGDAYDRVWRAWLDPANWQRHIPAPSLRLVGQPASAADAVLGLADGDEEDEAAAAAVDDPAEAELLRDPTLRRYDRPPVPLTAHARDWWTGITWAAHGNGARDVATTLYQLAVTLACAGRRGPDLAATLAERDRALGYDHYRWRVNRWHNPYADLADRAAHDADDLLAGRVAGPLTAWEADCVWTYARPTGRPPLSALVAPVPPRRAPPAPRPARPGPFSE